MPTQIPSIPARGRASPRQPGTRAIMHRTRQQLKSTRRLQQNLWLPNKWQHHTYRPCRCKEASQAEGSACSSSSGAVPVVVLPGFLMGKDNYKRMAAELERLGHLTRVADIRALQWLPSLQGSDFAWYLERARGATISTSLAEDRKVALVGHSAGGWLARLLMGTAPYMGRCWDTRAYISSLVTLGTPHLSVEAYPFGRTQEHRAGEPRNLPADVQGSSLRFANYYYTTAQATPGVKITCISGSGITGTKKLLLVGAAQSANVISEIAGTNPVATLVSTDMAETATWAASAALKTGGSEALASTAAAGVVASGLDRWLAGGSYAANCLEAGVDGDGVCPTCCALLPGARGILLPGVWHSPTHRPWYGSPEVVAAWEPYLE